MTRARRQRTRAPDLSVVAWSLLTDTPLVDPTDAQAMELYFFRDHWDEHDGVHGQPSLRRLWQEHQADILPDWLEQHPGTRPTCWWRWDGPTGTVPPVEMQEAILEQHGLLTAAERSSRRGVKNRGAR